MKVKWFSSSNEHVQKWEAQQVCHKWKYGDRVTQIKRNKAKNITRVKLRGTRSLSSRSCMFFLRKKLQWYAFETLKHLYSIVNRCIPRSKFHLRLVLFLHPFTYLHLHSQMFCSSCFVHVYWHLQDANTCMKLSPSNSTLAMLHAYQFLLWNWSNLRFGCIKNTSTQTAAPKAQGSHI